MLRVLGNIQIYGSSSGLEGMVSVAAIPNGDLQQVGTKRKEPDKDSWCYASPWYRFRLDVLDEEVFDFLVAHKKIEAFLKANRKSIEYALFTLCPVNQSHEEIFACLIGNESLGMLSRVGLDLEIAPASVMPEASYWKEA